MTTFLDLCGLCGTAPFVSFAWLPNGLITYWLNNYYQIDQTNQKEPDHETHPLWRPWYWVRPIIGIGIDIHKKLGPGFQEKIYEEALLKEFEKAGVRFQKQKVIRVEYEGQSLGNQRIDLLIDDEIILEIKACTKIIPIHRDQLISYLKTADKRLGLVLNFGRSKLEIKGVVHHF